MKVIIVLGNRNPTIMKKRVETALEYFNKSEPEIQVEWQDDPVITQYLLLSGGSSDGVSKPEGAVMMESFLKGKVDPKYCLIEKKSKDTIQNLEYSKKLIEKRFCIPKIGYYPEIVICTSSFHIKRSAILASFIFKGYPLSFIHTNEKVTQEEYIRETKILNNAFDQKFDIKMVNEIK